MSERIEDIQHTIRFCNILRNNKHCPNPISNLIIIEALDLKLFSCDYHKNDLEHLAKFLKLESRFNRLL